MSHFHQIRCSVGILPVFCRVEVLEPRYLAHGPERAEPTSVGYRLWCIKVDDCGINLHPSFGAVLLQGLFGPARLWQLLRDLYVQRSPLFCANIVEKDPGRARQNSLATAGTHFTKLRAQHKVDLCTSG